MKIGISSTCLQLADRCVGTRVTHTGDFLSLLSTAIGSHNTQNDRFPGQSLIRLSADANKLVASGQGRREGHGDLDYVLRENRGEISAYLKRTFASPVENVQAIIYTMDAFRSDPEVDMSKENLDKDATHVLVAVQGFSGAECPMTMNRFVNNLAGGNNEVKGWSKDDILSKALEIRNWDRTYAVVAD